MTVSLQLGSMLYSCPANWHRFIKDLETRLNHNDIEGFSVDQLNQELSRFKAQYIEDDVRPRLDFADERCYTMFILAYGGE
jgi:hypothetical protein